MACIEAMALGAVVVAADAGGLGEIVEDGHSGVKFAAGDIPSLEHALERALTDEPLRARIVSNAPTRARHVSDSPSIVSRWARSLPLRAPPSFTRSAAPAPRPRSGAWPRDRNFPSSSRSTTSAGIFLKHSIRSRRRPIATSSSSSSMMAPPSPRASTCSPTSNAAATAWCTSPMAASVRPATPAFVRRKAVGVIPIDGDDLAHPTMVEKLLGAIKRGDPVGGLASVSPMFVSFTDRHENLVSGYAPMAYDRDLLLAHNVAGPGGGSILDRRLVLDIGGYDEWLTSYEDWDMWCRLAKRGHRGVALPEFLLYYRLRPGSLMRSEAIPRNQALKSYLLAQHADMGALSLESSPPRARRSRAPQAPRRDLGNPGSRPRDPGQGSGARTLPMRSSGRAARSWRARSSIRTCDTALSTRSTRP